MYMVSFQRGTSQLDASHMELFIYFGTIYVFYMGFGVSFMWQAYYLTGKCLSGMKPFILIIIHLHSLSVWNFDFYFKLFLQVLIYF